MGLFHPSKNRKQGTYVLFSEPKSEFECPFKIFSCGGTLKKVKSNEIGQAIKDQIVCSSCGNIWLSTSPEACSKTKPTPTELKGWAKLHPKIAIQTKEGRKSLVS